MLCAIVYPGLDNHFNSTNQDFLPSNNSEIAKSGRTWDLPTPDAVCLSEDS